jgi:thiaminase
LRKGYLICTTNIFISPGKHYVYIHKYTSFLIKLVKETRDENTLEQLSRKLRKVQTLLLNYEQIMNELTVSEQTEQNKQVQ